MFAIIGPSVVEDVQPLPVLGQLCLKLTKLYHSWPGLDHLLARTRLSLAQTRKGVGQLRLGIGQIRRAAHELPQTCFGHNCRSNFGVLPGRQSRGRCGGEIVKTIVRIFRRRFCRPLHSGVLLGHFWCELRDDMRPFATLAARLLTTPHRRGVEADSVTGVASPLGQGRVLARVRTILGQSASHEAHDFIVVAPGRPAMVRCADREWSDRAILGTDSTENRCSRARAARQS